MCQVGHNVGYLDCTINTGQVPAVGQVSEGDACAS